MSRARDLLGHQISPRHTVPGMCTFPLSRPESIRKLLATPYAIIAPVGTSCPESVLYATQGSSWANVFSSPAAHTAPSGAVNASLQGGRTRSAQPQLDLLAGCIQTAHCVFSNGVLDLVLVVTVPVSFNCENGTAQGQPSRKASAGNA